MVWMGGTNMHSKTLIAGIDSNVLVNIGDGKLIHKYKIKRIFQSRAFFKVPENLQTGVIYISFFRIGLMFSSNLRASSGGTAFPT